MATKLLSFLLASAFFIQPVFAESQPAPSAPPSVVHSPIMPVKIKPRQSGADSISKAAADIEQENAVNPNSLGLYTRISDGGLGSDLWKNYPGKELAADLGMLNVNISSPTLRTLVLKALLTAPDRESFADDNAGEAFSSRLTTLVDFGAFDETVVLYKKLEGNIPSAKAALAGTEAIVSLGQMGLSCLEEKALPDELKNTSATSFWPDLNRFCNILLTTDTASDESETFAKTSSLFVNAKQLKSTASLSELNGKSVIEILAMNKVGLISESLFTPDNVKSLKPQIISLLLKQSPVDQSEKLSLLAVAADKGMIPPTDFINEFLTRAATPSNGQTGYWPAILSLYSKASSSTAETDKASVLKEVLNIIPSAKSAALLPFAAQFGSLKDTDAFTTEQARQVVSVLIKAKINVSGRWFAKAFGQADAVSKESMTDMEVISALMDNKKASVVEKSPNSARKSFKPGKSAQSVENAQLHALSLILNNQEAGGNISEKSYENLFNLTAPTDYVMPSKELMNNMTQAATRQDTGKVIIYSLQILNGQRASQIHPLAFIRISEGLQSVGLSDENRSLAHEVLADLIEN